DNREKLRPSFVPSRLRGSNREPIDAPSLTTYALRRAVSSSQDGSLDPARAADCPRTDPAWLRACRGPAASAPIRTDSSIEPAGLGRRCRTGHAGPATGPGV